MGATGPRVFDDDISCDFAADVVAGDATSLLEPALMSVIESEDYLDYQQCMEALAAAEIVAALRGNPSASTPPTLLDWLRSKAHPTPETETNARNAVSRVKADSETRDLWSEAGELDLWLSTIAELEARLT